MAYDFNSYRGYQGGGYPNMAPLTERIPRRVSDPVRPDAPDTSGYTGRDDSLSGIRKRSREETRRRSNSSNRSNRSGGNQDNAWSNNLRRGRLMAQRNKPRGSNVNDILGMLQGGDFDVDHFLRILGGWG
jgi:hypothetical protein